MHTDEKDDDEEITQVSQVPTSVPEATSSSKPSCKVTLDELVCFLLYHSISICKDETDPSSTHYQQQYHMHPSPTPPFLPHYYAATYSTLGSN